MSGEKEIAIGVIIFSAIVSIVVGAHAMSGVWKATDQIVQGSGDPRLQSTYNNAKPILENATTAEDLIKLGKK